jgi:hypothetical protein
LYWHLLRSVLTTVEVDERLLCDLSLDITLVLSLLQLLDGGVVGGDVGVVVLGVVQLHDLAADGGLEGAVVVWRVMLDPYRVQQYMHAQLGETYRPGQAE